ncbi:MAG TPA: M23 family peptidase, partial [Burkholderiaceae bacterium]|nr:M23 family peptidase [Burkholderiaceae bacterium]
MGTLAQTAIDVQTLLLRHRRAVLGSVLAVMTGFGVAAFAVAPLAPDAAELPRRLVTEMIEAEPVEPQLEALAAHAIDLYRTEFTRAGDTPDALFKRLGVADSYAAAFLRSDATARRLIDGRAGRIVQARAREDGSLLELVGRMPAQRAEQIGTHFTRITVARDAQGQLSATEETAELSSQLRLASGTIQSSLFAASDEARIPDAIAIQVAEIFAVDIDMHRELRR